MDAAVLSAVERVESFETERRDVIAGVVNEGNHSFRPRSIPILDA